MVRTQNVQLNWMDRSIIFRNIWIQLIICIICDIIGMATYIIPGLGEMADLAWAPFQTFVVYTLVGMEKHGKFFMALSFTEEILPLATDWIPSCTLAWIYKVWYT